MCPIQNHLCTAVNCSWLKLKFEKIYDTRWWISVNIVFTFDGLLKLRVYWPAVLCCLYTIAVRCLKRPTDDSSCSTIETIIMWYTRSWVPSRIHEIFHKWKPHIAMYFDPLNKLCFLRFASNAIENYEKKLESNLPRNHYFYRNPSTTCCLNVRILVSITSGKMHFF